MIYTSIALSALALTSAYSLPNARGVASVATVRSTVSMVTGPPPAGFVWADEDSSSSSASPAAASGASTVPAAASSKVFVLPDADAVGAEIRAAVEEAAAKAIAERGHFALAIPGGSVLKMLAGSAPAWADKCTLAYVNHKAVAMDDADLATHAKAGKLFLDGWKGVNAIVMDGTADAKAEAASYEAQLKALPPSVLPVNSEGLPVFDLMLIGVGDDGHVGSLYPDRDEVMDDSGRWVLPVEMKTPGSITLSLPLMAASKEVVIAACGVSDKYPKGKSAAMARAIEGEESPRSFPASGLRGVATWVLDVAAGGELSSDYAECFALQMSRGDCNPVGVN